MSTSPSSECNLSVRLGLSLIACRMLYEFHSWQNGKKSGTVHATYMIYGIKKTLQTNGHSQQDEDVEMTSSPPESAPQAEQVPLVTLSLVAEGNLTGTKCHHRDGALWLTRCNRCSG